MLKWTPRNSQHVAKGRPAISPQPVVIRCSSESLRFLLTPDGRDLEQRLRAVGDARLGHLHLDHVLSARKVEHHFHENLFEDRAEAAGTGAALQRLAGNRHERRLVERDLYVLEPEQLGVLLGKSVLRLL